MSGSLLNLATTALRAFQTGLSVTGNNIANVNNEDYTRQTIEYSERQSTAGTSLAIGSGVEISSVKRHYDEFINVQLRKNYSSDSALSKYNSYAEEVDTLLSQESSSMSTAFDSFFAALNQAASNPADVPSRQVLLSETDTLIDRFHYLDEQLTDYKTRIQTDIDNSLSEINNLASSISDLNRQISGGNQNNSSLLDQRDALLNDLAQHININVIEENDSTVIVTIGKGQVLVTRSEAGVLSSAVDPSESGERIIELKSGTASVEVPKEAITGGELGGMLDIRSEMIDPAQAALNQMALGITLAFNEQHQMGIDLNGNLGGNYFADLNTTAMQTVRAIANTGNTGNATVAVAIADIASLTGDEYLLSWDGANYTVKNQSTGTSNTYAALPQTQDGITISITAGAMAVGDKFLLQPFRDAAQNIEVNVADPSSIALAYPIATNNYEQNTGNGFISLGEITDIGNYVAAKQPVKLVFTSATTFDIIDTTGTVQAGVAYDPTQINTVDLTATHGFSVTLSGAPETGDYFTIANNTNGKNDNRNALALADLQNNGVFDGGNTTIGEVYGSMLVDVGTRAQHAKLEGEASTALLDASIAAKAEVSGVNLDEEASRLLQLQQAYQAAAQMIDIARSTFDALISAVR